jgi:hypothetical protein
MSGGRFFGSPTKLFEYMALGRAIVASDLGQIGEVLSPALRVSDLSESTSVGTERAILCRPGDAKELTHAVEYLSHHPDVGMALGRNARESVLNNFTWDAHIQRLWNIIGDSKFSSETRSATELVRQIEKSWASTTPKRRKETANHFDLSQFAGQAVFQITSDMSLDAIEREPSETFDLVYCPALSTIADATNFLAHVRRVLKHSGKVVVVADAENSYDHWVNQFWRTGLLHGLLTQFSIGDIRRRNRGINDPKVNITTYTGEKLGQLFTGFTRVRIHRSQIFGSDFILEATK